jgi:3D (Asp-Asp-Asp) domain-containing protein
VTHGRRAHRGVTFAARLLIFALAALAIVHPRDQPIGRPGELLRYPPTVVFGELRVAPLIVRAPLAVRPRISPFRPLHERARAGERIPVQVTAYCLRGTTRRGNPTRPGIVAADPKFFPLSRHVELVVGKRHLGRFLVDDTGGRIRGPILDLWTESCDDARHFGRRRGWATLR